MGWPFARTALVGVLSLAGASFAMAEGAESSNAIVRFAMVLTAQATARSRKP